MCYPWLNIIYSKILHSFSVRRGHHALILDNKWDIGEDKLVDMLVRRLMCNNADSSQYCNICRNCYLVNSKQHPNYLVLDLKENMRSVGIDTVRLCIDSIYQCMRYNNKLKIIFIKYVEYLTDQSINVFLKILDEPPVDTYFFFQTRKYMQLSTKLLSRCIRWSIISPKEVLGLQWLKQQELNPALLTNEFSVVTALRLCDGSPVSANYMLSSCQWADRMSLCDAISNSMIKRDFLEILPFLNIKKDDNISIYWLITLLMDSLKLKQGVQKEFLINLDQLKLINMISQDYDVVSLHCQLKQWMRLFYYFQKFDHLNRELWLVYRLLNWNCGVVDTCFFDWSI